MKQMETKFRVWDKEENKMIYPNKNGLIEANGIEYCMSFDGRIYENNGNEDATNRFIKLQYTNLKDKNGLTEIYEGDIIDIKGNVKGNVYEINQTKTDLLIQDFGGKTWCSTYKKAMERGCQHSK